MNELSKEGLTHLTLGVDQTATATVFTDSFIVASQWRFHYLGLAGFQYTGTLSERWSGTVSDRWSATFKGRDPR